MSLDGVLCFPCKAHPIYQADDFSLGLHNVCPGLHSVGPGHTFLNEFTFAVLETARRNVVRQVNSELHTAYWNVGRIIIEHEQLNKERAAYGTQGLKELSKALTAKFGKGFSRSNLQNMRAFF